jgi:hypothetical protein
MRASGRPFAMPSGNMPTTARRSSLLLVLLVAVCLAVGGVQSAAVAENTNRDTGSGPWTGFAFDACTAPSQWVMDRWLRTSPYLGVGVYIGGSMRACEQPRLTSGWVKRQTRSGWRLLPIWVGPQASCSHYRGRISPRPGAQGRYPVAREQGVRAARGATAAARALGIPEGTTLWYDIEAFAHRGNPYCRRSALRFLSAWTTQLHRVGYRSGVYSSVSAAIQAMNAAPVRGPRSFVMPDHIWFAWANRRPDARLGHWVRSPRWQQTRRVHQFALNSTVSHGGIRLSIDKNFVSLGRVKAPRPAPMCGVRVDFRHYRPLHRGHSGPQVRAAQCLLKRKGLYREEIGARYTTDVWQAVRKFQGGRDLRRTGRVNASTWTALLAGGRRAVLKRGSVGDEVRRVQRAVNAALPRPVRVTGVYGPGTVSAVRRYQRRTGQPDTGVVAHRTWRALAQGDTGHPRPHRHHARVRRA